jgi:hypothetical protein
MISYPDPQTVRDELGDKFILAFMSSVSDTRQDLSDFREWKPEWFVDFTQRFIANFIHERLWSAMIHRVSDHDSVIIVDQEPTRQIIHGTRYTIRFKRHRAGSAISSYPTAGSALFWTNRATLPTLESVSLAMGYIWDADLGQVGAPVLSFRDGKNNPIWALTLADDEGEKGGFTFGPIDPELPTLDLADVLADDEDVAEGE